MYQMKKGGSKSTKQQAAIAMAMKAAGKKPKKMGYGGNTESTPPKSSYSKFVGPPEPQSNPTAKQQADMKKISTPPTMKKGGTVKKMKMGGSCGTSRSMKKYEKGGNIAPGTEGPGPKKTQFQTDSLNFRRDEKMYNKKPSLELEEKILGAFKKYGTKKLTGKSQYGISDMIITDDYKDKKKVGDSVGKPKIKMGGSVKSKKK